MIIAVKKNNDIQYVFVDYYTGDNAKKVAFRYVHGRRETDFNELIHNTQVITLESISKQTGDALLRLV